MRVVSTGASKEIFNATSATYARTSDRQRQRHVSVIQDTKYSFALTGRCQSSHERACAFFAIDLGESPRDVVPARRRFLQLNPRLDDVYEEEDTRECQPKSRRLCGRQRLPRG